MNFDQMINALTPEVYRQFKAAIELRKWPNGAELTQEQLETCMQAVIAYEHRYLEETERTGYVPPKPTPCDHDDDQQSPLTWKE